MAVAAAVPSSRGAAWQEPVVEAAAFSQAAAWQEPELEPAARPPASRRSPPQPLREAWHSTALSSFALLQLASSDPEVSGSAGSRTALGNRELDGVAQPCRPATASAVPTLSAWHHNDPQASGSAVAKPYHSSEQVGTALGPLPAVFLLVHQCIRLGQQVIDGAGTFGIVSGDPHTD